MKTNKSGLIISTRICEGWGRSRASGPQCSGGTACSWRIARGGISSTVLFLLSQHHIFLGRPFRSTGTVEPASMHADLSPLAARCPRV